MSAKEFLIEAQMHSELINEAFAVLGPSMRQLSNMDGMERFGIAWQEANARLWAVIHLIQSERSGAPSEQLEKALLEARAFDQDGGLDPSNRH